MSENETTTTEAAEGAPLSPEAEALVEEISEALKDVIDPELGVNVVDLGLLYGVNADDSTITLDMTLTSAACPLTDVIEDQATSALDEFEREVKINWVWMPPWGPDKITDDGRDQLRMLGFNV
ncbi:MULTISPECIES: metal-sulfur cluster assembly factor [Nocardiopsis]|uniref:Metal-sulfur cluster assembly factor n=1 Tax=Nocardiopsis akebiae TaxID=2831968 RepID=A0ABX8C922_9ACTN|nr:MULTISPECIES: metal-sulfur cluster assembly factor [Nocardiopsis]QUX30934.1 metal-sulfur cluster assembly factor [Nocardiopsis akebiae]WDZ89129.1 metal-sulfur cluster assembly factor [Nocardiopsis sp. HUAS JQ3]